LGEIFGTGLNDYGQLGCTEIKTGKQLVNALIPGIVDVPKFGKFHTIYLGGIAFSQVSVFLIIL
jgi:hypothetical protein